MANDWQAGLVPVYMCYKYRRHNCYSQALHLFFLKRSGAKARAIYVIHNLGYQGQCVSKEKMFSAAPRYHGQDACRFFGIDDKELHAMEKN